MSGENIDRDETHDHSDLLGWLDEMAEAEGKSRETLVRSLVSSYWTLDEMAELVEQSAPDAGPATELSVGRPDTHDGAEANPESLAEDVADFDHRLRYLRGEIRDLPDASDLEEMRSQVASLSSRIDSLEAALDAESDDPSSDGRTIDSISDRLDSVERSLSGRQDAVQDRIDTEFHHLHAILEHLVQTTGSLEERTARLEGELTGLDELRRSQERVSAIKRAAARLGVTRAKCERCNTSIEVAILPDPHCPHCDGTFVDVEPKRGWFGSASLVVSRKVGTRGSSHAGSRPGGTPSDGAERADSNESDGVDFDWVGENG